MCPEMLRQSIFIASTSMGILPTACGVGVEEDLPRAAQRVNLRQRLHVPISLFTAITETIAVSSRIASCNCFKSIKPLALTGKYVTSQPCCSR